MPGKEARCKHGDRDHGHEERGEQREGHCHCEIARQPPGHPWREEQRKEHGHRGEGGCGHGPQHLRRPLAGRLVGGLAFLSEPRDVFDDYDGVADQLDADRPPAPLWNRVITREYEFTPYTSDTMDTTCDATPSPLSLTCLSCHDTAIGEDAGELGYGSGAVSVDDQHNLFNEPYSGVSDPNCYACHPEGGFWPATEWQIGPDLSDDHPISMTYPTVAQDPDFNSPPTGGVKLYNGRVECPSCHNPHDPDNFPFLRESVDGSTICLACHKK